METKDLNKRYLGHNKKPFRLVLYLLSAFLLVLTVSSGIDAFNKIWSGDATEQNVISVSGQGRVFAKSDIGTVNVGVITEADTVEEASQENTEKMNQITKGLQELDVSENDLKTTNYNVYPKYSYPRDGEPVIRGYEVSQTLQVKIRDLSKSGEIIGKATSLGANNVSSLSFTVDETEAYKQEARQEAIRQAKQKAEALANELGVRLVKLKNFSENSVSPVTPSYDYERAIGIGGGGGTSEISTGENEIVVEVYLVYQIK